MRNVRVRYAFVFILAIFNNADGAENPSTTQTSSDDPPSLQWAPAQVTFDETRREEKRPKTETTTEEVSTSVQLPPQTTCDGVKAEPRSVMESIVEDKGNWMLRMVTPMEDYHTRFGRDRNYCSVFHYGPDCWTVHFLRFGSVNYITSYNPSTRSFLITRSESRPVDPHYAVDRETIIEMENYNAASENGDLVNPALVKEEMESEYALVILAPHGCWSILRTCDKKKTWVKVIVPLGYPKEAESHKIISDYDAEIEAKLKELEIPSSTLRVVPLFVPQAHLYA